VPFWLRMHVTTARSKLVADRFEAGRRQASNMSATSFEPDSVMEFGFNVGLPLVFSERICCRPSVCLSVTLVRPTYSHLSHLKFSAMFLCHLVPWPPADIDGTFYGDRSRETSPSGEGVKRKTGSQI